MSSPASTPIFDIARTVRYLEVKPGQKSSHNRCHSTPNERRGVTAVTASRDWGPQIRQPGQIPILPPYNMRTPADHHSLVHSSTLYRVCCALTMHILSSLGATHLRFDLIVSDRRNFHCFEKFHISCAGRTQFLEWWYYEQDCMICFSIGV